MKFSVLVGIVPDEVEDKVIDTARKDGAGGVTILNGRGIGFKQKKTFFGLTFEGSQSVLIFMLEHKLSIKILKALKKEPDLGDSMFFTVPISHLTGINMEQLHQFEEDVKKEM